MYFIVSNASCFIHWYIIIIESLNSICVNEMFENILKLQHLRIRQKLLTIKTGKYWNLYMHEGTWCGAFFQHPIHNRSSKCIFFLFATQCLPSVRNAYFLHPDPTFHFSFFLLLNLCYLPLLCVFSIIWVIIFIFAQSDQFFLENNGKLKFNATHRTKKNIVKMWNLINRDYSNFGLLKYNYNDQKRRTW